jgi:hypothetical protein
MPCNFRSSARLFANRADTGHEQFRRDAIFPSSLLGRRIAEDGDRASNISECFSLDLPGSYLPGGRVSSSSVTHASNYCASPSPFDVRSLLLSSENESPSLPSVDSPLLVAPLPALHTASLRGRDYSPRFPEDHRLLTTFVQHYHLGDELGSGGYGFVMTAIDLRENVEVAVKFIIKEKVPEQAWIEDEVYGRIPIEVLVLHLVDHENIVKCLEFFEDELFFYLVSLTLPDTELFHFSIYSRSKNSTGSPGTSAKSLMKLGCSLLRMTTSIPRPPCYLLLCQKFRSQILSQRHPRRYQDTSQSQFAWKDTIHP